MSVSQRHAPLSICFFERVWHTVGTPIVPSALARPRMPLYVSNGNRLIPREFRPLSSRWGRSSAGRAPRSQCGGQGFDPPRLHQNLQNQRLKRPRPALLHTVLHRGVMGHLLGLSRRRSRYYYRCRVPAALVGRIGRRELGRSLQTAAESRVKGDAGSL